MAILLNPFSTTATLNISQGIPAETPRDQLGNLTHVIEKIQAHVENSFSEIAFLTVKNMIKEFKEQSCLRNTVKVVVLPTYLGVLGLGVITSYSGIVLLVNAQFASALSSNTDERVNFANNITNAGALLACMTDLPAISYWTYLFVVSKAHNAALHRVWNEGYHTHVDTDLTLSQEMHEELYRHHLSKLKSLGVERFYQDPDTLAHTGALHKELAPLLEQIDSQIEEGPSLSDIGKKSIEMFKQDSCFKRCVRLGTVPLSLGMVTLASFLILENLILLTSTPVGDLFSSDENAQTTEAFYLTQLGGLFASITAFGAAIYLGYYALVRDPYQRALRDKIETTFSACDLEPLSLRAREALMSIKAHKSNNMD